MTVRKRMLPATMLLAAMFWSAVAHSQQPGPGQADRLPGTLTPDQVKRALQGFSTGGLPDLPPDILELFKDRIQRDGKAPINDRQLKDALDRDPNLRKQIEELGKRFKQGGGGAGGKDVFTPDDLKQFDQLRNQLQQAIPKGNGGMPPQPPFPPQPNPGQKNLDPPPLPPLNPMLPQPMGQPNPMFPPPGGRKDPLQGLDPAGKNPLDRPTSPNEKAAQAAASLWERNIGPLDDTPAVKRALFELIEGTEDLQGPDGKSFWEELAKEQGDSTSLSDLLDGASLADSWTVPKFELPEWKLFGDNNGPDAGGGGDSPREGWWSRNFGGRNRSPSEPRAPSGGGGGINIGIPSVQGGWLPVVILAAILFGGLLVWRFWGVKWTRNRATAGLYGPDWPIDPRRITTREHVVIAFEYLSVLICGPSAKTWTHNTIADALADLARTQGETAVMLARLYELARYAPLDEALTTSELAEARRLVCALAGLEHE